MSPDIAEIAAPVRTTGPESHFKGIFNLFIYLFIWLHWVFVAVLRLSLTIKWYDSKSR